ncbi:hypothetical protein COT97_02095 [Candidatus Falkowbacteria bacterium CG10_big_fil_rev_8_21_14_0_10_39_11]|uniref:Glutamyl-tRNA amidotransferase n=1 Tax=Candidatus Falkowbacteria bacterium CG10_big_fil_rev_8_21_14_0_10_39_11 TaxID=1974565 RepID=A0A2H0V5C2_9BACT|nr:MAG: hypothetical protein COT97_02095 [Candidatus Falkowbacteria bacterium CG10_big_fil_rev_8_21_14_0_10_39_11]
MKLQERIEADFIKALKEKNKSKLNVLRGLRSSLKNKEIDLGQSLNEQEIVSVIRSEIKKRREAIESYTQAGRDDLREIDEYENVVLENFVPAQLSVEQVEVKVREIVDSLAEDEKGNFGQVMGRVMKEMSGQADGQVIQVAVKKLI